MNQNATCKLCGKNAKLLKKSHIIPNFMYNGIHDSLNRMIVAELTSLESKPRFQQTGYFEKYVLCSKCDNERIGNWERYVALVLFGGLNTSHFKFENSIGKDGVKSLIIKNIDYAKFKLCLLSILWRAHISNNIFFKNIDLKENSELIRQMLLVNDPKDELIFKISILAVRNSEGLIKVVIDPTIVKIGKGSMAIFFINGIFYFIELIPGSDFTLFQKHFLNRSGIYEIAILEGKYAGTLMTTVGLPQDFVDYYIGS